MSVRFMAVGDIGPDRDDPNTSFNHVRDTLLQSDVGYCQLELNLTTRGQRVPQARHTARAKPEVADALVATGLGVVSFAGNHTMDWGPEGMLDTLDNLERAGALHMGAGATEWDARKPVIVEKNGVKIGFLAVSSILPQNYWAVDNKPGCAGMRGLTVYEQIEHDQPGTPARIHTFPHREDLAKLVASIEELKPQVDHVVISHHAGIHFVKGVVPDYQRDVAYACIDAGADIILGCHAHVLKGMEYYKGKPIIYSLSNFAIDLIMTEEHANSKSFKEIQALDPDWVPNFDAMFNLPPSGKMTVIADFDLTKDGITDFRLIPTYIEDDGEPRVVGPGDPKFDKIRTYLTEITEMEGFATRYEQDGDILRPVQA